ncbi:ATP-grasp domain-containing protein [Streptomyces sp. NPDC013455]|uniref:ATP-grasp domain-containing protein n=1 Tax=Streptomyces sp. NPDC013455 TaxID=3155605 RepID=UPI0033D45F69
MHTAGTGRTGDRGVLLLSHVGFSFMEDLIAALGERGLRAHILTSLPEPAHQPGRLRDLADRAASVRATESHELTVADVDAALDALRAAGTEILACLTVWEGYRHLMAHANARLGVPDLGAEQVLGLRDKLAVRERLAGTGLSRVRAVPLTEATLAEHQARPGRYFVKPVRGIASYGTFPLTADTTWEEIRRITEEAGGDTVYASAFGAGPSFLIEDYLPGREFSFEVLVADGEPFVVAVHEKCEVTETSGAVLENACTSPPVSVGPGATAAGLAWVSALLAELGLNWGCFHIEARHDGDRWDLIEINPRVGGSLISPSVRELTGETDLLGLWLDLLLSATGTAPDQRDRLRRLSYRADGTTPAPNATFFRVFFAEPGLITGIGVADGLPLAPAVTQILLKEGELIEARAREVFLGQLLWAFPAADRDRLLPALTEASATAVTVTYAQHQLT